MNNLNTTCKIMLLAVLMVIAGSCKKEIIPPPSANEPVFRAEGTFGGEAISLLAGDNNVLMSTEIKHENGVDFYEGILGNSQIKLQMGIFAGDLDLPSPVIPELSNATELGFCYQPYQPLYTISKDSFSNSELISQIQWEVNGEMISGLNVLNIYEPGKYQICAHVTFTDYTSSSICNEVFVGFRTNADFQLNFFLGEDLTFKSWIKPTMKKVQSVRWFRDGVEVGGTEYLDINLTGGPHLITAEVAFDNGVKRSKNVLIDGSLQGKNIDDFTTVATTSTLQWDYMAKIKVTKDGTEYSSESTSNNQNRILVDDITYYGLNPAGQRVYLMKGSINANLKSVSGTVLPLDLDVSFGFAVE